jgi:iron(III) transport system substrate-binding protein
MRKIAIAIAIATLTACSPTPETGSQTPTLTVYSGRGESLIGPLFERLQADGRFKLQVQYGDTAEMVTRLMTEAEASPADIILAQDSGHLGLLSAKQLLEPLPEALLQAVDPRFSDPDGRWIGTSGRLRVLVYNTQALDAESLPKSLQALADPVWKGRLGWAPSNGSFQAHVGALRNAWGEDETESWLRGVIKNEPTRYPKNSPQVEAAHTGAIDLGWVNHYYLHRLDPNERKAANWSFPTRGDVGNVLMVAGAGIRAGSPNTEAAQALLEALVAEDAQTYFAQEVYEYPTRPGIAVHEAVQPLDAVGLADVDQAVLADLGPTRQMLQRLGLL